jgi:hypothetical protein
VIKKPIENSYWVVPGKLLAGEYPRNKDELSSQEKIDSLLQAGVRLFLDLTERDEGLLPYHDMIGNASHQRHSIRDVSTPKSTDSTIETLNAMDRAIEDGKVVYVHCWGGVGRTGLIIGCWLARHGEKGEMALTHLRELWQECPKSASRKSPETPEQEQYILGWTEGKEKE